MKKIVMATLLATSLVAAHAQVAVSGKIGEWIDSSKVGTSRSTSVLTEATSNVTVTANEKLNNGLTARVVVDTSLSGNTISGNGTQIGDRQSTVGIVSKFGSIDVGRNVHSQFLAVTNNDAFGTLYGSVAGDIHNLRGLRFSNGAFVTVNPYKNVTVSYDRAQTVAGTDALAYGVSGTINGVATTVARFEQGIETSTVIAANYKLGNTQVFASRSEDKGLANSTGKLFGAKYNMGNISYKASYGTASSNVTAYALGADYALSKRTEVGVSYRSVNRTGSSQDVTQYGVGLTHRF